MNQGLKELSDSDLKYFKALLEYAAEESKEEPHDLLHKIITLCFDVDYEQEKLVLEKLLQIK